MFCIYWAEVPSCVCKSVFIKTVIIAIKQECVSYPYQQCNVISKFKNLQTLSGESSGRAPNRYDNKEKFCLVYALKSRILTRFCQVHF